MEQKMDKELVEIMANAVKAVENATDKFIKDAKPVECVILSLTLGMILKSSHDKLHVVIERDPEFRKIFEEHIKAEKKNASGEAAE